MMNTAFQAHLLPEAGVEQVEHSVLSAHGIQHLSASSLTSLPSEWGVCNAGSATLLNRSASSAAAQCHCVLDIAARRPSRWQTPPHHWVLWGSM